MRVTAGVIPYIIEDGQIHMLFMISSDANYGGDKPMISKGGVDPGESLAEAAMREGHEELGLVLRNCVCEPFEVATMQIAGRMDTYPMTVFAVEVADRNDFEEPHYETAYTTWLTATQFQLLGRRSHIGFVDTLVSKLETEIV